ncbi:MAG: hypothetical protein ACM4D3_17775 [Candidatus Sericytochromatia bacterium]
MDTTCAGVLCRPDGVLSSAFLAHKAAEAPHHEVRGYPAGHSDMYHGTVRDQVAAGPVRVLVTPPVASAGGY